MALIEQLESSFFNSGFEVFIIFDDRSLTVDSLRVSNSVRKKAKVVFDGKGGGKFRSVTVSRGEKSVTDLSSSNYKVVQNKDRTFSIVDGDFFFNCEN